METATRQSNQPMSPTRNGLPRVIAVAAVLLVGGGVMLPGCGNDAGSEAAPTSTATTVAETTTVTETTTTTVAETTTTVAETTTTEASAGAAEAWPSPRAHPSVVLDEESGKIVVFGGSNRQGTSGTNDTWAFDVATEQWTRLEPAKSPSFRMFAAATYHPGIDRMVVFGGAPDFVSSQPLRDDLWLFDLESQDWTRVDVAEGPGARQSAAMVYVDSLDAVLLFGGNASGYERSLGTALSDAWLFDAATATWSEVTGEGPPVMDEPTMVYDPGADLVFVYGGLGQDAGSFWVFDPSSLTWTSRPNPQGWVECTEGVGDLLLYPSRCGLPAVYDQSLGRMITVDGDDLLSLDVESGSVERSATSGAGWAEGGYRLVMVPTANALFLFNTGYEAEGWYGVGTVLAGELWRLDLSTLEWRLIGPRDE